VAIVVPLNVVFGIVTALALARGRFRGAACCRPSWTCRRGLARHRRRLLILLVGADGWLGGSRTPASTSSSRCPGWCSRRSSLTLPFVVREVEPVLQEIGDEAGGGGRHARRVAPADLRRITLPAIRWGSSTASC